MSFDRKKICGIACLVLPVFVLGGLWIKAGTERAVGQQVWQVKIRGYDPRDLFYGRYMRFRYDWNIPEDAATVRSNACLCLTEGEEGTRNPVATPMQCDAYEKKSCVSLVNVQYSAGNYNIGHGSGGEKYFIPEEKSAQLDDLFRSGDVPFHVELMAHADGRAVVRGLIVDGQPMEDYLRDHDGQR